MALLPKELRGGRCLHIMLYHRLNALSANYICASFGILALWMRYLDKTEVS
jgi:hypothetical protein